MGGVGWDCAVRVSARRSATRRFVARSARCFFFLNCVWSLRVMV